MMLSGCKKENGQLAKPANKPTAFDYKINHIIENFKSNLKSHLKDGEEISTDSVIWFIEASLNETYARMDNTSDQVWIDSAFVDIPLTTNGMVLLSNVADAYNTLIVKLTEHYYSIYGDNKELLLVNISLLTTYDDKITLRMQDYIGDKAPVPPPPNAWTFGLSDHWYWGLGEGKCIASGFQGLDAATQITLYANNSLPYGGNTNYFTFLNSTNWIMPDDVQSGPNPFGYFSKLLYENGSAVNPETSDCLEPAAMNYYLDNLKQIALLPQYLPVGKSVANYSCISDIAFPYTGWLHIHRAMITYGVPILAIDPPKDL